MRANAGLTRVTCAGIVDADAYDEADAKFLQSKGIAVLPVSEIENLFLLPNVIEAIASEEGYSGDELQRKCDELSGELFSNASNPKNQLASVMRYCLRRIDGTLKKIDVSSSADVLSLAAEYSLKTNALDVVEIGKTITTAIQAAIQRKDATELLKWYDNKGVLSIVCKAKGTTRILFEQWIVRALRNGTAPQTSAALKVHLPKVKAI